MAAMFVGYARVASDSQELTAQRAALLVLGVDVERIYVDYGLTGTNRDRPGLREALAACRDGDTRAVTKPDRVARSLPDARDIVEAGRLATSGLVAPSIRCRSLHTRRRARTPPRRELVRASPRRASVLSRRRRSVSRPMCALSQAVMLFP
jgi:hypothetical protein